MSIGYRTFAYCTGLTSITIPDSVTVIEFAAFKNCSALADVYYEGTHAQWDTIRIDSSNDYLTGANIHFTDTGSYCGAEGDGSNLTWSLEDGVLTIRGTGAMADYTTVTENGIQLTTAPWGTEITRLIAEDGVTHIGSSAFAGCTALTEVTLADSVTGFGSNAFRSCTGLTSFTVPDGVTALSQHLFRGCTGLTGITIPNSVTSVAAYAFTGCSALTDVWYSGTRTQWDAIAIGNFNRPLTDAAIHCAFATGTCSDSLTWTLCDDGTLVVSGNGALLDLNMPDSLWDAFTSVVLEDGITRIGNNVFSGHTALTSVTIPGSVTSIGEIAFDSCTSLSEIVIPEGVPTRQHTVDYRGSVYRFTLPESVTDLGDSAFNGTNLGCVVPDFELPQGIGVIGAEAFAGLPLRVVRICATDGPVTIGSRAFAGCTQLRMVIVHAEDGVTIAPDAFEGCTDLTFAGLWLYDYADEHGFGYIPDTGFYGN